MVFRYTNWMGSQGFHSLCVLLCVFVPVISYLHVTDLQDRQTSATQTLQQPDKVCETGKVSPSLISCQEILVKILWTGCNFRIRKTWLEAVFLFLQLDQWELLEIPQSQKNIQNSYKIVTIWKWRGNLNRGQLLKMYLFTQRKYLKYQKLVFLFPVDDMIKQSLHRMVFWFIPHTILENITTRKILCLFVLLSCRNKWKLSVSIRIMTYNSSLEAEKSSNCKWVSFLTWMLYFFLLGPDFWLVVRGGPRSGQSKHFIISEKHVSEDNGTLSLSFSLWLDTNKTCHPGQILTTHTEDHFVSALLNDVGGLTCDW